MIGLSAVTAKSAELLDARGVAGAGCTGSPGLGGFCRRLDPSHETSLHGVKLRGGDSVIAPALVSKHSPTGTSPDRGGARPGGAMTDCRWSSRREGCRSSDRLPGGSSPDLSIGGRSSASGHVSRRLASRDDPAGLEPPQVMAPRGRAPWWPRDSLNPDSSCQSWLRRGGPGGGLTLRRRGENRLGLKLPPFPDPFNLNSGVNLSRSALRSLPLLPFRTARWVGRGIRFVGAAHSLE